MIRNFQSFVESISGTELVGPVGPGYGETRMQNKTIDKTDTSVIYSDLDGRIYTEDEYNDIYGDYLKNGLAPLDGFSKKNIDIIILAQRGSL